MNLVFSSLLHYKSISSIWNTFGTLSTSAEKGSANSWKVSRCTLKSANTDQIITIECSALLLKRSVCCKMTEIFAESWVFHNLNFVENFVRFHTLLWWVGPGPLSFRLRTFSSCVIPTRMQGPWPIRIIKFRNIHSATFHESLHLCS